MEENIEEDYVYIETYKDYKIYEFECWYGLAHAINKPDGSVLTQCESLECARGLIEEEINNKLIK